MEDSQAGFALIAAAFMTGLWAWVAQKAKSREEVDRQETTSEIQHEQNLFQGYKEFNEQLQRRILSLNDEFAKLLTRLGEIEMELAVCKRMHFEDINRITELERKMIEQRIRSDRQEERSHRQDARSDKQDERSDKQDQRSKRYDQELKDRENGTS